MPDTYEATDPKTGKTWTWDGKKWNPKQTAQAGPFTEGFASSMGFSRGNLTGAEMGSELWQNLKKGVSGEYQRLQKMTGEEGKPLSGRGFSEALLVPGLIGSGIEGLATGFETAGKDILTPGKRTYGAGELLGSLGQMFAGVEGPQVAKGIAKPLIETPLKKTLRSMFGAGEPEVGRVTQTISEAEDKRIAAAQDKVDTAKKNYENAMQEYGRKTGQRTEAAQKKLDNLKQKYSEARGEYEEQLKQSSAKQSAAQTKQQALVTKQGPVYQRMNEMADAAQKHISQIEEKVGKREKGKWDAFRKKMGNPMVQTAAIVEAIEKAQAGLAGENVPIFKSVLSQIAAEDPMAQASIFKGKVGGLDVKEMLQKAPTQAARDHMLRELKAAGFTGEEEAGGAGLVGTDLPLDNARNIYTRMNRVLNARELPRPIARAIQQVTTTLDDWIVRSIAERGSKLFGEGNPRAGLQVADEYRQLKRDYARYRETFSDKDSPLRKVTEAKDPHTKLNPITGETGQRAVDYLGRYRELGAKPEMLGRIRAVNKTLKELPGGTTKATAPDRPVSELRKAREEVARAPEKVRKPQEPEYPQIPGKVVPSAEEIRQSLLGKRAQGISVMPSGVMLFSPKWMAFRAAMRQALRNKSIRDWLASDR